MLNNDLEWWYEIFLPYMSEYEFAGGVEGLKNFMRVFGTAYIKANQNREDIPVATTMLFEQMMDVLESLMNKDNDNEPEETVANSSEMD